MGLKKSLFSTFSETFSTYHMVTKHLDRCLPHAYAEPDLPQPWQNHQGAPKTHLSSSARPITHARTRLSNPHRGTQIRLSIKG